MYDYNPLPLHHQTKREKKQETWKSPTFGRQNPCLDFSNPSKTQKHVIMKKQAELFTGNKQKATHEQRCLVEYIQQGGKTTPKPKTEFGLPLFEKPTPKQGELF